MDIQQQWRDKWLKVEQRPLELADLTCGTCGYVPDWLRPVDGGEPYLAHAQGVKREVQQSQLLFHLTAHKHGM